MNKLKKRVVNKLINNNLSISSAESCTGGLFASTIVSCNNASKIFNESYVTYSNEAKIKNLNVNFETLERFGAVSEQTAREMVVGLKNKTKADICISITGIAGPTGGTNEKPVGLIYIGFYFKNELEIIKMQLNTKNRNKNRLKTVIYILRKLDNLLE